MTEFEVRGALVVFFFEQKTAEEGWGGLGGSGVYKRDGIHAETRLFGQGGVGVA